MPSLNDGVVSAAGVIGWMRTEHPHLTLDGAGFLAGGAGSAACQSHIYELLGV